MKVLNLIRTFCIAAFAVTLPLVGIFGSTTALAAQAHIVTVGSPDGVIVVAPGNDGNYSLIARQDANGNVSGEWQDAFTQNPGFHMKVTCLTVVGNTAWLNGVITQASNNAWIGLTTLTQVVDNTTDGSGDSISFTFFDPSGGDVALCSSMPALVQFSIIAGNVIVK